MQTIAPTSKHDRSRYEGKNLLRLLLALGVPALILYFGVTLSLAASESRVTHGQYLALTRASRVFSGLFFVVQLGCARYVQRLLKTPSSRAGNALQYVAVLLLCIFISATAAVACEAFGYEFFLGVRGSRR